MWDAKTGKQRDVEREREREREGRRQEEEMVAAVEVILGAFGDLRVYFLSVYLTPGTFHCLSSGPS